MRESLKCLGLLCLHVIAFSKKNPNQNKIALTSESHSHKIKYLDN